MNRRASNPEDAKLLRLESPSTAVELEIQKDMSSSRSHRKINFNVSEQYEIIDIIGEGAYGVVA